MKKNKFLYYRGQGVLKPKLKSSGHSGARNKLLAPLKGAGFFNLSPYTTRIRAHLIRTIQCSLRGRYFFQARYISLSYR